MRRSKKRCFYLRKLDSENWIQIGRPGPAYADIFSGFQESSCSHQFPPHILNTIQVMGKYLETRFLDQEGELSLLSGHWSLMSSKRSSSLESSLKTQTQAARYGRMEGNFTLQSYASKQASDPFRKVVLK